jgi:hypothetical protein
METAKSKEYRNRFFVWIFTDYCLDFSKISKIRKIQTKIGEIQKICFFIVWISPVLNFWVDNSNKNCFCLDFSDFCVDFTFIPQLINKPNKITNVVICAKPHTVRIKFS